MMSPGWASARLPTGEPTLIIAPEVRGNETPNWANTYCTNPEQSQPDGLVPPYRYG